MADRAKVIYDLERCTCHVPDACRDCSKYNAEGILTLTCMESLMKDALELLKEQPEIIRCKDCKHYDSETQSCNDGLEGVFLPDWFCADGERR